MTPTVTYPCPRCRRPLERPFPAPGPPAPCPHCDAPQELDASAIREGKLVKCPACELKVLYHQKDFRQAVGCTIVGIAAVLAPFTPFYSSLIAAALLDLLLYSIAGEVLICYRHGCRAHIRGTPRGESIAPFDLSIHDYYRSLAREPAGHTTSNNPEL